MSAVAVYGGSFNPLHVAHVLCVAHLLSVARFERVLVVPVFHHAFDKQLAPFEDRVHMCELGLSFMTGAQVSRVEERLSPPNYTLHTLQRLHEENPDWRLRLVVGSDVLGEAHKWHEFERVCALAPLWVVGRVGHPHPDAPTAILPDVSSTHIRKLLSKSRSAGEQKELEGMVPARVLDFIAERGLYS